MKVVPFIVSAMLALAGAAHADIAPPGAASCQAGPSPDVALRVQQHALRRQQRELARRERAEARAERRQERAEIRAERRALRAERREVRRAIRRYDLNGDGNVDQSEMPPAAAERLRRLDRNGDGWVDDGDFR